MKSQHKTLKPGHNCWRIERADKVAFLIDGSDYFRVLHNVLTQAQHSIQILAWDIDSQFKLVRDDNDSARWPQRICDLLDTIVKHRKLDAYVLNWDFAMIYGINREFLPIFRFDWQTHRRMRFCLDDQHPVGASQHQKVVVVDDMIAFSGGLDITNGRWDTSEHLPGDLRRCDDDDQGPPRPYHDIQMAVTGNAAAALGDLARQRWLRATGHEISQTATDNHPWPSGLKPDLTDVDVAIARTEASFRDHPEIREVETLYLDMIAAAHDLIYIENQYFTAGRISDALAKRLEEDRGPEVVMLLPLNTEGWLAQSTMDVIRQRLIKSLQRSDRHNRLRVYYPHIPNKGDQVINLHAKAMIIDDELVRIGSSNLNNRSMGLDTECDLVIEACGEKRILEGIANLRHRLLGEHLGTTPGKVANTIKSEGSVIAAIESLRGEGRSLRPLPIADTPEPDILVSTEQLIDPERPVEPDEFIRHFVTEHERPSIRNRIGWWVALLAGLLIMGAAWRWTPLNQWLEIGNLRSIASQLNDMMATPLLILGIYLVASLVAFPLTLLIVVTLLVFGSWQGFIYAFSGAILGAIGSYVLGHLLGRNLVRRMAGRRLNELSRRLARRGLLAIIAVRIIPVAPFTVINLVAGASHIRFRDYLLGTVMGMMPGIIAISLFTDRIIASLTSPDIISITTLTIVIAIIAVSAFGLYRWVRPHSAR